ncbi:protein O-mannosyl-transferase TMTC1-like isoform X1 [Clytia hemisphaerica]
MAVVLFTSKTISYNRVWKTRETLFRAGVHTLPHNAKAHYNYANFLKDENRTEQAVYHYKKAVELYPPHSSSHNNLGTLLQNDQPGVAEYHFNEAIKHTPGHYRAMFNIAHIYRSRGEYEKACDILKTCLSLKPTYFDAKLLLADSLNELGRAAESIKLYQMLHKEHQDNYQVNHNFAAILQKQGYQKEAINIYSNLLTKDPKNENILNKLATVYKKAGNNEMAVTLYQRAILAHPKSSKAYQNLALLYYERREFQKSRDLYEKLMQISPNAEHKRNYAIVLFALREHREAIRLVDGNIQEQPSDMQSHHLLINFLVDTQEYQKGKVAIERALKISPGDQRVLLFKANILRNTKSYAEAIKIYRHLIHKNGRNMDALINLGTIYHIQDCSENLVLYKFAIMRRFLMEVCFLFSIMAENLVLGSLPCYICGSKKSLEDCEERQTLVPGCEGNLRNESTCYIFESVSSEGVISVGKNCMKSSMCNEKNGCHGGGKLCKVYCCNTPGCNKSSRSYAKRGNWFLVTISLLLLTYLFAG